MTLATDLQALLVLAQESPSKGPNLGGLGGILLILGIILLIALLAFLALRLLVPAYRRSRGAGGSERDE